MSATLIDEHRLGGVTTQATMTLQAALKNSSRSVADLPLSPGGVHPLYGSAHSGADGLHIGYRSQILAPLLEGDERTLHEVLFEQLAGALVQLWF
jgi:hypothetical protein